MKVTVFPLAFYILLKNQEIRGTGLSPWLDQKGSGKVWQYRLFVVSLHSVNN